MLPVELAFKNEGKRKIVQKTEIVHHQIPLQNKILNKEKRKVWTSEENDEKNIISV